MELKELKYILSIAEYRNISHAANALYISQPSLSRFLNNLEKNLGIKLFDRVGNKYMLTYAGERYIKTARMMISLKNELDHELQDMTHDKKGRLRIGFSRIRGSHVLPNVLPHFLNKYPQLDLQVTEAQSTELEELIKIGKLDFAIMNRPIDSEGIESVKIQRDYFLLAVPKNHPLCKHSKRIGDYNWIDLSLFKEEPFILTDTTQRTRKLADKVLSNANIVPNILLTTQNIETSIKLVGNSVGVCFTPESFTTFIYLPQQPEFFLIGEPPITSNLVAAYRSGGYLSDPAKFFLDLYRHAIM